MRSRLLRDPQHGVCELYRDHRGAFHLDLAAWLDEFSDLGLQQRPVDPFASASRSPAAESHAR